MRPLATTCTLAATLLAAPAAAQERPAPPSRARIVMVGAGVQAGPRYPGAGAGGVLPLFVLRFRREGDRLPVRTPEQGAGIPIVGNNNAFAIGPVVAFQAARRDRDVPVPIGRVGFTVEPGGYAQFYPLPDLRLRGELRHGVGGHAALVGDVEAAYVLRPQGDRWVATIGPRLRFASDRYARAYFGVPASRAAATGLPAFDARGGLVSANLSASLLYKFDDRWGVSGFAGYERLFGDGDASPLVRRFGRRGAPMGGAALTYSFRAVLPR